MSKISDVKITKLIMPTLIATMLIFGFIMSNFYKNPALINAHKSMGVVILIVALLKFFIDYIFKKPKPYSRFLSFIRSIFILVTIVMPLSGLLMVLFKGFSVNVFNLFTIPSFMTDKAISSFAREAHIVLAIFLAVVITSRVLIFFVKSFKKKQG